MARERSQTYRAVSVRLADKLAEVANIDKQVGHESRILSPASRLCPPAIGTASSFSAKMR